MAISPMSPGTKSDRNEIRVPVSRFKALIRAVLWGALSCIGGAVVMVVLSRLSFTPSGVSNRIVDYSIGFVTLPIALLALAGAAKALRWMLLCVWPGSIYVSVSRGGIGLRLGPMGNREYDSESFTVRYPFEFSEESGEAGFEAYLPQEEQFARFLPRIEHPRATGALNEALLLHASAAEADLAADLRPFIEHWRSCGAALPDAGDVE